MMLEAGVAGNALDMVNGSASDRSDGVSPNVQMSTMGSRVTLYIK